MAYNHPTDDIPLQNRQKQDVDANDHVYQAPPRQQQPRKGLVQFGQLGMFGADAKRITWVVYIFTIIQIAVFIAELVKNGKFELENFAAMEG
jgi:hypothetical protein